jgi:hypothetical protein
LLARFAELLIGSARWFRRQQIGVSFDPTRGYFTTGSEADSRIELGLRPSTHPSASSPSRNAWKRSRASIPSPSPITYPMRLICAALLRARRERPSCCRPAEHADELAPL